MSDEEIDRMIAEIDQMAQRIGCRFFPDARKLDDFRRSQRERREWRREYEAARNQC
jgi:hypothetical protein